MMFRVKLTEKGEESEIGYETLDILGVMLKSIKMKESDCQECHHTRKKIVIDNVYICLANRFFGEELTFIACSDLDKEIENGFYELDIEK